MGAPPQNIFSVAAATPEGVQVSLCDETIGMKPALDTQANIVALFFHTPDAPHAYALADKFRQKGRTVVLGGLHASFLPEEAAGHADAVLVGEAEGIWEELIYDHEAGTLKKIYKRERAVDLAEVKPYPTDLIPPSKYGHFWSVLVSRGCVHRCEYCAVPPFFCGNYRVRPIGNIVDEIRAAQTNWFELHADNLTADRKYALELFRALKPLKINWMGEATIKMADDAELLSAAAESGCKGLLIGIETPSQAALEDSGKGFVDPDTIRDKIDRFHDHGIKITSSMIFGFDTHTHEIFEQSEAFCRHIGIDEVESVILIPFPGTTLYERMVVENRILTADWSRYDGSHAVFRPINMTPEELEAGAGRFWKEIRKRKRGSRGKPGGSGADSVNPGEDRARRTGGPALTTGGAPLRWKSMIALGAIGVGLYHDWYWIWGALLIIWALTDLRDRHTYLLEDIPRSESPFLYWIVVLMWLLMGIWALSTSPVFAALPGLTNVGGVAGQSPVKSPAPEQYTPVSQERRLNPVSEAGTLASGHGNGLSAAGTGNGSGKAAAGIGKGNGPSAVAVEKVKTAIGKNNLRRVKNERFGFDFRNPEGWELTENQDDYSVSFHLRNEKNTATLTVTAVDYKVAVHPDSFISSMEKEYQEFLPFFSGASPTVPRDAITIGKKGEKMIFREYLGDYEGEKVVARVGYAVHKTFGYAIIGVFAEGDRRMQNTIDSALADFRLAGN